MARTSPAFELPSRDAALRLLPGVVVIAAVLLLLRGTAQAMVEIWSRSDTFAHAFLVPPIVLWLIWRVRHRLGQVAPKPQPWLLVPVAGACLAWLLGELVGVNALTQFALVLLIVLCVPAVYGLATSREIAFPLAFLFFAVPIGEFMVPFMMEWTADFTVAALVASGIPVYREGLQFVIPSGNWSVVEACSGVRYLIASFMVGTLFAYLNFRSTTRRLVFIVFALLVPIVANWLRAYLIVLVGHLSGNKLAAGADHLVYGWVFFGVIIAVMFMIGARWAEPDEAPAPARAGDAARPAPGFSTGAGHWLVVGLVIAVVGSSQWAGRSVAASERGDPVRLALPDSLDGTWRRSAQPLADWEPAYRNANATAAASYSDGQRSVALWVGYYRDQHAERKLVTSTNLLVDPAAARWTVVGQTRQPVPIKAVEGAVDVAQLRQPADPALPVTARLTVMRLYWVGGHFTGSATRVRLQQAWNRLLGRGDDAAVVLLAAPRGEQDDTLALLASFANRHLGPIGAALEGAKSGR